MDPPGQHLPTKENAFFKRILKCYEQKQYKNGLKFAKQILQNFPNHGETQAMKGLTLNCLGRKEEAYQLVRQGLLNNLCSHVCWHVFGLLQRSDKKYDEAIKCYRNALKWDKDNLQILRDLSLLQIQMRDLEGYRETRYKLFELRPTQRASWIGYAMSCHLLKDYNSALKIIEIFRKTMQKGTHDYEYSEFVLYQNLVMREAGLLDQALQHIITYEDSVCDTLTATEIRGDLLLALDRPSEATEFFRKLIDRNPENKQYYLKLEQALQLETVDDKLELYKEFSQKYPRAHVPKRLPLNYASGDQLEALLDPYLQASLLKGVPPLFTDVLSLYAQPGKADLIERLMYRYLENLDLTGKLNPQAAEDELGGATEPACVLFVLMFLAEHHSRNHDPETALTLLQRAVDHTPTLIELYIIKGQILKHAGDLLGAVDAVTDAQTLDTADRYVNSKCASYMLAANLVPQAHEMCSKFTREGVTAMENLNEMQCMWFQTDCAHAYYRMGQYGESLKMCHQVNRHFTEIIEDQFDFHTYCMRKMTLCSYVELLRLEDVIRSNEFYWKAAKLAITIYLRLHDKPVTEVSVENDINTSQMSPAELKKYRSRQRRNRKAEERKQEEKRKEEKKLEQKKKQAGQDDLENPPQEELVPYKLERPAEPLTEALIFLRPLQSLAPRRLHTHLMAFTIHLRRDKPLLMMQALKRAHALEPSNPELHTCAVQFLQYCADRLPRTYQPPPPPIAESASSAASKNNQNKTNANQTNAKNRHNAAGGKEYFNKNNRDRYQKKHNQHQQNAATNDKNNAQQNSTNNKTTNVVKAVDYEEEERTFKEQEEQLMEVVRRESMRMFNTIDPRQLNEDFLNKCSDSIPHRLQAARSMVFLDGVQKNRAITIATELGDHLSSRDLKNLQNVLEWLEGLECHAAPEEILRYQVQCHKFFPRAQAFITEPANTHTTTITTTTAATNNMCSNAGTATTTTTNSCSATSKSTVVAATVVNTNTATIESVVGADDGTVSGAGDEAPVIKESAVNALDKQTTREPSPVSQVNHVNHVDT